MAQSRIQCPETVFSTVSTQMMLSQRRTFSTRLHGLGAHFVTDLWMTQGPGDGV